MSTPQSIIQICSGVRLNPGYEHSVYFATRQAQEAYFAGKVVHTFPAYSYLRKSWPLQVQATMEQAKTWSYLFFRNGSGKTYYYFITSVEYKNDNMVELTLELDVLQTYLFDFKLLDCFVERQHTVTDKIGEHTIDEGLEVGELVDNKVLHWDELKELCILVLATINPNYTETEKPVDALGYRYDNVFSGLTVWAVDADKWADWSNKLNDLTEKGFIDGIVAMWMYPKSLVTLGGGDAWEDSAYSDPQTIQLCKVVQGCGNVRHLFAFGVPPATVDGYTPKNNKVLCYPYNFLYASNNSGNSAVYRYERFTYYDMGPVFKVKGSISPEGTVKMFPVNYNGLYDTRGDEFDTDNYEQGMTLGNFPACAWDADVYKLWLAQNQNQHQLSSIIGGASMIGGAVSAVASLAMGNVIGAVGGAGAMISGAQQIGALMAQKADMAIQPPQSRGSFSANVNMTAGYQTFSFYAKSVDAEHARSIDQYFTMYGYKINQVQKPNMCARKAFTYVKTVGCHIKSDMCTEDVLRIESIFDKGITFWVDGDRIADYSQDNSIEEEV